MGMRAVRSKDPQAEKRATPRLQMNRYTAKLHRDSVAPHERIIQVEPDGRSLLKEENARVAALFWRRG